MIRRFVSICIQLIEDLLIGGWNSIWYYLFPIMHPRCVNWWSVARWLQWLTFLWLSIGLIVLCSASYPSAQLEFNDGLYYVKRQLLWTILGILEFNLLTRLLIKDILKISSLGIIFSFLCLLLTFPMGISVNGASRWIAIGPILLQPSEIIKPFLILQSSYIFSQWDNISYSKKIFWVILFISIIGSILIQPNLSTASLCGAIIWLVALTAGINWFYLNSILSIGAVTALISLGSQEYQRQRIISFLNPWANPTSIGYQLVQSLLAVGSGRLTGSGISCSYQKLFYLPIQYTDFIFSVFSEEFGLLGAFLFISLLIIYFSLGMIVVLSNKSKVNRLLALGSIMVLVGQSLINIGVSVGILPTTGLPLPFFSYGGNSILATFFVSAILIRVAIETEIDNRINIFSLLNKQSIFYWFK